MDDYSPPDVARKHIDKHKLLTSVGISPGCLTTLTRYDAHMLAIYSASLSDISTWVFADLLVWAEERVAQRWGKNNQQFWTKRNEAWDQLMTLHKKEYSRHTLYNMRATAKAWPWTRRRHTDVLSFEHHRLLVGMDKSDQDELLNMAQDLEWPASRLRQQIWNMRSGPEDWSGEVDYEKEEVKADILWSAEDIEERAHALVGLYGGTIQPVIMGMMEVQDSYLSLPDRRQETV